MTTKNFHNIIMLRIGQTKVAKEKFMVQKNLR